MILGEIPQNKLPNKSLFQGEKSASKRDTHTPHRAWNLKCLSWGKSPGLVSFSGLNSENNKLLLWVSANGTQTFL